MLRHLEMYTLENFRIHAKSYYVIMAIIHWFQAFMKCLQMFANIIFWSIYHS